MPTVQEVALEAQETTRAIQSWNFPASFIERLESASNVEEPSERASARVQHWRRLRESVVLNCRDGLGIVVTLLRANRVEEADAMLGRVQTRWRRWLEQVRDAERDRMLTPPTTTERVNDAMNDYYDAAERVAAAARDLPGNLLDGVKSLGLAIAGGALLFVLSRRR